MDFEELRSKISENVELVEQAYDYSKEFFKNHKRISGEDHFNHPFRVAMICAENGMDSESVAVALLHGINTFDETKSREIREKFGENIANLFDEVVKINLINKSVVNLQFADELRKMILSSSKDLRVIFIKLADKLDNMRTLEYLEPKQQKQIAKLTLEIYAPIANRLGLGKIKSELEDLSLKFLNPEAYQNIRDFLPQKKKERELIIDQTKTKIHKLLEEEKINARILGRPKNIYSIYKKSAKSKLEDIHDLLAFRIIVESVKDCYEILRLIHTNFKPIPNRLKDYIASPKENNYRSIHTTVFDESENVLEIQIRTEEMDREAEEGISAHFAYKGFKRSDKYDKKISWLKEIVNHESMDTDFVDLVKLEFFSEKIYCITPAGKVINLPKGSTAIDFAYAIHSKVGDTAIGVRINGKYFPLRTEIKNGELIEVITQKNHVPSRNWLKFARTHKARSKIRRALSEVSKIPHPRYVKREQNEAVKTSTNLIDVENMQHYNIKFARCCNPLPGEEIIAVNINGFTVNVHKKECLKLKTQTVRKDRLMKSKWKEDTSGEIEIKVLCKDRKGLMVDMLNTLSRVNSKISGANAKLVDKEKAELSFKMEVDNLDHIRTILNQISKVNSVNRYFITKC